MKALFPYQETSRDFLAARTRALLADEPRVGKTPATIAACDMIGARRIFVVAPAVALYQWRRMFQEFGRPRDIFVLDSDVAPKQTEGVFIASYDRVRLSGESIPGGIDVLIIDESHYLGNPSAARTRCILGKGGFAWKARRIWCLSGTPATSHAAQLWPLLRAFGLTDLNYDSFMATYCVLNPHTNRPVGVRNAAKLRERLAPIMLRRTLKEVAPDLPPLTVEEYTVRPDAAYLEDSDRLDEQKLAAALEGLEGDALLSAISSEHIATLRRYHALLKINGAAALIKEEFTAGDYERLVVFAHHESVVNLLAKRLQSMGGPPISVRRVTGKESAKQKDQAVEWFRADGGRKVFLGNILAAGTAIDLSCANEGLAVELDWTPGNNVQALRRMLGPAQTLPVRVRVLIADGTIDERIVKVLTRKARDLNQIFSPQ